MIAQFKQDLFNKNFSPRSQGKDDQIDTLQNRNKVWLDIFDDTRGPVPDNLYEYDYNDERLNHSVRGAKMFPEIGEFKKLLGILRCK